MAFASTGIQECIGYIYKGQILAGLAGLMISYPKYPLCHLLDWIDLYFSEWSFPPPLSVRWIQWYWFLCL